MLRLSPLVFDLGGIEHLWVRPDEECQMILDFGLDVSGWTFVLFYSEHNWPYMPFSYDQLAAGTISTGFTFTDNVENVTDAVLNFTIDKDTINSWVNRKLDIRLQANDGTNTWIVADRTLTVAQGD